MIVEVTQDQINIVRELVSSAQMGIYTPQQVARYVRDSIGITQRQAGWVRNFRDRTFNDQITAGKTFAEAMRDTDNLTDRYAKRIHRYRAEMIARTEILRAANEGRNEAWRQGIEEGYINPGVKKYWSVEIDGRQCEECVAMGDQYDEDNAIPISDQFVDGDPPLHPMCRCDVLLSDRVDPDIAQMTDEQLDAEIDRLLSGDTSDPVPKAVAPDGQPPFDDEFAEGARNFTDLTEGPEWGNREFAEWQNMILDNPDEALAINEYSDEGLELDYRTINSTLRAGDYGTTPDIDERIDWISSGLSRGSNTETVIGVRGLTRWSMPADVLETFNNVQPGSLIHDPGFMSVSLAPKPALGEDIYVRVKVPPGSQGGYLGRASALGNLEQEYLLQAGTTVRVQKVETLGPITYIDAEVVAQNPGSMTPPEDLINKTRGYRGGMARVDKETEERPERPPRNPRESKFVIPIDQLVIINPR